MSNVTALTFVIGVEAAAEVRRKIESTLRSWKSPCDGAYADAEALARVIERRLSDSPRGFEIEVVDGAMRLIWESSGGDCGILYVVEDEKLQTINLICGSDQDQDDLRLLAARLSPIAGYARCLEIAKAAPTPLIATFCNATGGLNASTEAAVFTFAAVFFSLAAARPGSLELYPVQPVPATSNRGAGV